jgi:hypothetical protein
VCLYLFSTDSTEANDLYLSNEEDDCLNVVFTRLTCDTSKKKSKKDEVIRKQFQLAKYVRMAHLLNKWQRETLEDQDHSLLHYNSHPQMLRLHY